MYEARNLTCVKNGVAVSQNGLVNAVSGSIALISQVLLVVRPVLVPPCISNPF